MRISTNFLFRFGVLFWDLGWDVLKDDKLPSIETINSNLTLRVVFVVLAQFSGHLN